MKNFNRHLGYIITIGVIAVSVASLWLDSRNIPQDVKIFYWPLGVTLLFWNKCISLPIAIVSLIFWGWKNRQFMKEAKYYLALIFATMVLLGGFFLQYLGLWAESSINHVGTAYLDGRIYHVAEIYQFDERSKYYLGECEKIGYRCEFHHIFTLNSIHSFGDVVFITKADQILLKFNSEEVFTTDGIQETCMQTDTVFCSSNNQ